MAASEITIASTLQNENIKGICVGSLSYLCLPKGNIWDFH